MPLEIILQMYYVLFDNKHCYLVFSKNIYLLVPRTKKCTLLILILILNT